MLAALKNRRACAGGENLMNVKKSVDYSLMFAELDTLMKKDLPQMELYCEIGRLVNSRPEKGAVFSNTKHHNILSSHSKAPPPPG